MDKYGIIEGDTLVNRNSAVVVRFVSDELDKVNQKLDKTNDRLGSIENDITAIKENNKIKLKFTYLIVGSLLTLVVQLLNLLIQKLT